MTPPDLTAPSHENHTERSTPDLVAHIEHLTSRVAELEREKTDIEAYAAVAAHELVEPLVMAEAYAAIISTRLGSTGNDDSIRDLEALSRGVARTRLLAVSMLHDARTSNRRIERRPIDMTRLVGESVALLRPEIESRSARVESAELPDAIGEEALVSGVVANLLINALKYSPRESQVIRVGGAREETSTRYYVESDGPAIASHDRERIFRAYQRGPGERRAAGTGLGLAICSRIVERHGGEIGVTAANGSGNRFFFTLPL
jgi:light-regulated signal transduction histidine kinase (bacteriophytochrome)